MLKSLLSAIGALVRFKKGPEAFPPSLALLIFTYLLFVVIGFTTFAWSYVISSLLSLLSFTGLFYLVLRQSGHLNRLIQTLTAFVTIECLASLLLIGLFYGMALMKVYANTGSLIISNININTLMTHLKPGDVPDKFEIMFSIGLLGICLWKLALDVFIVKRAVEWKTIPSLALVFVMFSLPVVVEQLVLSTPSKSKPPHASTQTVEEKSTPVKQLNME